MNTKPYGEGLTIILLHRAAQPAKQLVRVSGYCGKSCDGELLTWQVRPVRDTLSPTWLAREVWQMRWSCMPAIWDRT